MISRAKLFIQIEKSRMKAIARENGKDLNYLLKLLAREARYEARMVRDRYCENISFAINVVSVISPDLSYYLLYCVGYNDIRHILKSIRRHDRKKLKGH